MPQCVSHHAYIGPAPRLSRIQSAKGLVNIPAFRVEEDLGRWELLRKGDGFVSLDQPVQGLLFQAAYVDEPFLAAHLAREVLVRLVLTEDQGEENFRLNPQAM